MYEKKTLEQLEKKFLDECQDNIDLEFKDWLLINELHSFKNSLKTEIGFITDELEEIRKTITSLKGI